MSPSNEGTTIYRDIKAECESIAKLCRGSEASLQEIGRRMLEVPTLSEMAIHAANATTNGVRNTITRVDQAVLILGTQRIHSLARELAAEESSAIKARHRKNTVGEQALEPIEK